MKKLLISAALALAVAALTGCGPGTGKPPSGPPALIQPADHTSDNGVSMRMLKAEDQADGVYEIAGTNSRGHQFTCYAVYGTQSVAIDCIEYPKIKQ